MKNLKHYLNKAHKDNWAIPQFNFSDFTQLKAIVETCAKLKSPAILGTSEGESKFFGLEEAVALRNVLRKKYGVSVFLNLDHGKSFEYLEQAVKAGYDMVHFDGSKLPFEENIKISKEVVKIAKWKGIIVEGEMGRIGTDASRVYSEGFQINEENLTKPEEAKDYVNKTGVNLLAISIGNFHGITSSREDQRLRIDLLKNIKESVAKSSMFVLHGGSGVPEFDIKEAISNGIVKININTESRVAFSGALREFLNNNPEEIVPYKYLVESKKAMEVVLEKKIKLFSSSSRA